jgi:SAM-dependent methyltransferase
VDRLLEATARAESKHFWFRGFRWFVTPMIERAVSGRSSPTILDCGCGTGANLELLSRFGAAYGFDISEVGLYIAVRAGRHHVARAKVAAVPFPSGQFDLVTSFDVLYSLPEVDERCAVAEMYRLLRPGGFALVNVAAMEILRGDHSILSQELRRYSKESLGRLMAGAGFELVRITYTNQALFLPMLAVRMLQRRRGLARENDADREITVPWAPINAALTALLFLEGAMLRHADAFFGSSLLCLAKKPDSADAAART